MTEHWPILRSPPGLNRVRKSIRLPPLQVLHSGYPEGAAGVLVFKGSGKDLQPDTAWRFNEHTPSQSLEGCFQGAILDVGKGKIAVFGEAAMFTTQLVNGTMRVGFNSESAPQNAQFVLNLVHWLDGVKDYR